MKSTDRQVHRLDFVGFLLDRVAIKSNRHKTFTIIRCYG